MELRPTWHPLLAAQELEPGHWVMLDTLGDPYGDIRIVRRGDQVGYRVERDGWVGYFTTLRKSAEILHARFLRDHTGSGTGAYGSVR